MTGSASAAAAATTSAYPAAEAVAAETVAAVPSATQLSTAALQALGNQNSVSVLISTVLKLGGRLDDLPPDVRNAAARVMQAAITISESNIDAVELRNAAGRSGVFLEANLATPVQAVPPRQDLKALLLLLRGALAGWLGGEVNSAQMNKRAPPPARGANPRAFAGDPADIPDEISRESLGRLLFGQTDAALSRLRLLQMASLPDPAHPPASARSDLQMEIPFVVGQEAGTINVRVNRDGGGNADQPEGQSWTLRFALDVSALGEVGADIGLLAQGLNVVVWADRVETAKALSANLPDLTDALSGAGLDVASLRVRRMHPNAPAQSETEHLLDLGT